MSLKQSFSRIIGPRNMGRLDFIRQSGLRTNWGGPFNGQQYRSRIFAEVLDQFPIMAIVETGTHRGTTTAALAATGLPVYTIESDPRYFAYSQLRFLRQRERIHAIEGDSRLHLRRLARDPTVPRDNVFFYLDAHWQEDLPLREEVEIIFSHWTRPLVMADDFRVPDSDYGFDDYGQGKRLDLAYIETVVADHSLSTFFPKANASDETGSRRGCVVLCTAATAPAVGVRMTTLIRHP